MFRRAAAPALAAIAALALAGCTFFSPVRTLDVYDASDGVSAEVGDVQILNAFAISEDGETVSLVFAALNSSDENVRVNVSIENGDEQVTERVWVDAGTYTQYGAGDGRQLVFSEVDVTLGQLLPVYFQYGSEQGVLLQVPVLTDGLAEYGELLPTPTPTPTEEPEAPEDEGTDGQPVDEGAEPDTGVED